MKLKTLKEMGLSEAEISIYEKVKKIRNERNIKDLIFKNYSTPLFIFIFFISNALSTLISIWLLISVNNQYGLIQSISFSMSWILIGIIFMISCLSSIIFLFGAFCLAINNIYAKKEKEIEHEIYKHD